MTARRNNTYLISKTFCDEYLYYFYFACKCYALCCLWVHDAQHLSLTQKDHVNFKNWARWAPGRVTFYLMALCPIICRLHAFTSDRIHTVNMQIYMSFIHLSMLLERLLSFFSLLSLAGLFNQNYYNNLMITYQPGVLR